MPGFAYADVYRPQFVGQGVTAIFEGIPIYKQFEKRRKAERERRKREEEDKKEDT